jgi:hypothetical protein
MEEVNNIGEKNQIDPLFFSLSKSHKFPFGKLINLNHNSKDIAFSGKWKILL